MNKYLKQFINETYPLMTEEEDYDELDWYDMDKFADWLVKNNAVSPHVSGSLPIDELRSKLLSMRFSKEEMRAADNEKELEMYGFTDCINQLLEWLQPQRQ